MSGWKDRRGFGRAEGRENEQTGPDAPMDDLTGNGIVKNGPDNELSGLGGTGAGSGSGKGSDSGRASGSGGDPGGDPGGGPSGDPGGDWLGDLQGDLRGGLSGDLSGSFGGDLSGSFGGDELALRRMLHNAVQDLEPADGVLDHLRKAVPTRRARKRQAIVGMAAAALLFGTAVPAFVHVANSGGLSDGNPVNAGHGQQQGGKGGGGKGGDGTEQDSGLPSDKVSADEGDPGKTGEPGADASGSPNGVPGGTASPGDTYTASSPTCDASQLQVTTAEAGSPGSDGKVYGTFRVANVSGADCSVNGSGSINFQAAGAADATKISVVAHTAGDAASGLPDPSLETNAVVLGPNSAYEVQFAWVPTDSCPSVGPSPDPTATDDGSSGVSGGGSGPDAGAGSGSGSGSGASNAETQLVNDGGTADGSVSVSHTAEPGAPNAQATIPNACAGTIYRTGVLSAS
ncbi:hypothetical protein [Streptomyces sp. NPDC126933]|uniref:hypothetical protein n=1 Tax=unclassified Streptomyces TaxID=2593676 RepID=UPI0036591D94